MRIFLNKKFKCRISLILRLFSSIDSRISPNIYFRKKKFLINSFLFFKLLRCYYPSQIRIILAVPKMLRVIGPELRGTEVDDKGNEAVYLW